jgi:CHAD domain-containing protein
MGSPFVKAFFDAAPADPGNEPALHQFRIRGKKLRYVMEALQGAFPEEFRTRLYASIQNLQDRLGEINDLAMARARLEDNIRKARKPSKADMWRRLLAEEEAQALQARRAFWQWCTPAMLQDLSQKFDRFISGSAAQDSRTFQRSLELRA